MKKEALDRLQYESKKRYGQSSKKPKSIDRSIFEGIREAREFNDHWAAFKETDEYKKLLGSMLKTGGKMPYSENILYRAYYSGYFKTSFT